ncbi:MAG TPA: hypothetical protein VHB21_23545, partial [Minicystis sp.]|nr:hypothetical protein [Minicystis sp.]
MARSRESELAVTPHPVRRVSYAAYVMAVVCLAGAGFQLAAGDVPVAFPALAAVLAAYAAWVQSVGHGAQVLNKALNLASAGKLAEAEALLSWGERAIRRGRLDRALSIQRALIAMRRGDVPRAL